MTTSGTNDAPLARAHHAMWMRTIRESLERSVPFSPDDAFDDLLAQLDKMPTDLSSAAPALDKRAPVSVARRDAALEARLSRYVDLLNEAFARFRPRAMHSERDRREAVRAFG